MATAKLSAQLGYDGKEFNAGIDGASKKVESFKETIKGVKSAIRFGFALAFLEKFGSALKDIQSYQTETGIKIFSDKFLNELQAGVDGIERFKIALQSVLVTVVGLPASGLSKLGAFFGALTTGVGVGKSAEIAEAQAGQGSERDIMAARVEAQRAQEVLAKKMRSDEEQLLFLRNKQVQAQSDLTAEQNKEFPNYVKVLNLQKQIAEDKSEIIDLEKKLEQEEIRRIKKIEEENKRGQQALTEMVKREAEESFKAKLNGLLQEAEANEQINDIIAERSKIGMSKEDLLAKSKKDQENLKALIEMYRDDESQKENALKYQIELEKEISNEKKLQLNIDDERNKKLKQEAEIRKEAAEKIEEISSPEKLMKRTHVSVEATSAAKMGMWMGEKDRSRVAIESKDIVIQAQIKDILEDMNKKIESLTGS